MCHVLATPLPQRTQYLVLSSGSPFPFPGREHIFAVEQFHQPASCQQNLRIPMASFHLVLSVPFSPRWQRLCSNYFLKNTMDFTPLAISSLPKSLWGYVFSYWDGWRTIPKHPRALLLWWGRSCISPQSLAVLGTWYVLNNYLGNKLRSTAS